MYLLLLTTSILRPKDSVINVLWRTNFILLLYFSGLSEASERIVCRRDIDVASTQVSILTNLVFNMIPLASVIASSGPQIKSSTKRELMSRLVQIIDPAGTLFKSFTRNHSIERMTEALRCSSGSVSMLRSQARVMSSLSMRYAEDVSITDSRTGNTFVDAVKDKSPVEILMESKRNGRYSALWLPRLTAENKDSFHKFTGHIQSSTYGPLASAAAALLALIAGVYSIPSIGRNAAGTGYVRDSFILVAFGWVVILGIAQAWENVQARSVQKLRVVRRNALSPAALALLENYSTNNRNQNGNATAVLNIDHSRSNAPPSSSTNGDDQAQSSGTPAASSANLNQSSGDAASRNITEMVIICNGVALPAARVQIYRRGMDPQRPGHREPKTPGRYYHPGNRSFNFVTRVMLSVLLSYGFAIAATFMAFYQCPYGPGCKTWSMVAMIALWIIGFFVRKWFDKYDRVRTESGTAEDVLDNFILQTNTTPDVVDTQANATNAVLLTEKEISRIAVTIIASVIILFIILLVVFSSIGLWEQSFCTTNANTNYCGLDDEPKVICRKSWGCEEKPPLNMNVCNIYSSTWICKEPSSGQNFSKKCDNLRSLD